MLDVVGAVALRVPTDGGAVVVPLRSRAAARSPKSRSASRRAAAWQGPSAARCSARLGELIEVERSANRAAHREASSRRCAREAEVER